MSKRSKPSKPSAAGGNRPASATERPADRASTAERASAAERPSPAERPASASDRPAAPERPASAAERAAAAVERDFSRQLRQMNEALLVSSVRQHELTDRAEQGERTARDVTATSLRAESLVQCQKDSLELLVKGEPIERVLDFLARGVESQSQGRFLVAIHLMEADGHHFGYVAAPGLPARYAQATRGMDARLELGCCSSAVMSHTPTVVRDFADAEPQERWPAFTAEVVSLGLRGCFTTPILSPSTGPTAERRVLGTFAIYYREPGEPSPRDQQLVDFVTSTVALAIERKRAEHDLRESEERYRTLFNSIDEGFCIIEVLFDSNGAAGDYRFLTVNPAFARQTGLRDAVGKRMRALAPDHEAHWFETYGKVALTGTPVRFVNQAKALDGRWYDVNAFRIGAPELRRVAILFDDITERRRTEQALSESEERFRTVADNIAQLAWTADAKGWIYWYNRRWYDYTGATLEEMQGWGWKNVHHPDHVERVVKRIQHSWDTGEPWEDLFPLRSKDGEYRWFLSRALAIRDVAGNVLRWFGTNTDVTEQREMEQQIQKQAALLTEESRRKDEFLAMLSHELRNPLAPIRSAVQLLKKHAGKNPDGNGANGVAEQARATIERQVATLTRLINDLLDVSRVVSGRIRLEQQAVELNQVLLNAIETIRPLVDRRGHELVLNGCPDAVWASADALRIEQVLVNLLSNAAKYTPDGGRIEVACETAPGSGFVQVRVRDSGVGMDAKLLPRVFDLFTQADRSLDRAQGGLGVGLNLVKRLVELHGGSVEARSDGVGQGSEFIVRLPRASPPAKQPDEQSGASVPAKLSSGAFDSAERRRAALGEDGSNDGAAVAAALRVLVVDDNADACAMLASLVRLHGGEVQTADSGPAALAAAHAWHPDVMLLDIGLPGFDGFEVARRLRADPLLAGVKLVALTGYGSDGDIQLGREAGFDAHLLKPVDLGEIEKLLAGWAVGR